MAASDKSAPVETVMQKVSEIAYEFERLPKQAPEKDLAGALNVLNDIDKISRKLRQSWTSYIVQCAKQGAL